VVAVGTVVSAKDGIKALRQSESLLNICGGNGHGVAWLVTTCARAAICAQTLKKRPSEVDASARCTVSLRRTCWIGEERSVWDESELLSTYSGNRQQRGGGYENSGEEIAFVLALNPHGDHIDPHRERRNSTDRARSIAR
jgi:hypothetical protein